MKKLSFLLCLFFCLTVSSFALVAEHPKGYAVATAHPLATRAAMDILALGGNAFDAAVAASAVLAVVEPYHSGLGGGGFWLLHQADTNKNSFIDGREVAPLAAHSAMFLSSTAKVIPNLSLDGGLAAAIPGEPAALVYLAKHYGHLPLSTSLKAAIELAEKGFVVDYQFNYFSTLEDRLKQLQHFPDTAAVFLHQGKPYKVGECLKQPDLAKTLTLLAEKGRKGFYEGEVAENLVKAVNQAGGIWTLEDLQRYRLKIREPLVVDYPNLRVITAPLPSAGGVGLITMLNILQSYSLEQRSVVDRVHYIVEAMRLAFWQRSQFLADPAFEKVPLAQLLSTKNAAYLRTLIYPFKARASTSLLNGQIDKEAESTTHISILDREGNRVAATMSVNFIFGSSVIAKGTGVLLNDEMDDFTTQTGVNNVFGIVGSQKNQIVAGKRPLSSMTPTFLEQPGRVAIVGTPGGSRIPTMLLLATLAFKEGYGAISMVSNLRFHHQCLPDVLQFEPDSFNNILQNKLEAEGYKLMPLKQNYGDMQAISWDIKKQIITAASDPRHAGLAFALTPTEGKGYGINH